jgi:hypothetical protein
MKKLLFLPLLLLVACTSSIADIKTDDNLGKKVTVQGEVKLSVKIGSLSGFILGDETGTISVQSDTLPEEGDIIKVSGTLTKDILLGYYILADSIR